MVGGVETFCHTRHPFLNLRRQHCVASRTHSLTPDVMPCPLDASCKRNCMDADHVLLASVRYNSQYNV